MPYFSIIIPSFDAANTIGATLDSLEAQSFPDWEAICIDDGSTDQTRAILMERAARNPRIIPIANPGKGPSAARNYAADQMATGKVIAFCDADDLWTPTKLGELHHAMDRGQIDGVFGQIGFFQQSPKDSRVRSTVPSAPLTVPMLLGENPVCTMSNFAVHRRTFLASGGFDETMVHNEDLEFLIRLVGHGANVQGLDQLQVWYRTNSAGLSSDLEAMRLGREKALQSARVLGFRPDSKAEAIHLRYLARRALRLDSAPTAALRMTLAGLTQNPPAFLLPARRGFATAIAALISPALPRSLRQALFSH